MLRWIKFTLINGDKSIDDKMMKEEFFNFLSLTSAFRDVVIGEADFNDDKKLNINSEEGPPSSSLWNS